MTMLDWFPTFKQTQEPDVVYMLAGVQVKYSDPCFIVKGNCYRNINIHEPVQRQHGIHSFIHS